MFENDFNSTETTYEENYDFEVPQSGEQEGVVDSLESQYGDDSDAGDGHEGAVGSQYDDGDGEDDSDAGAGGNDSGGADQSRARQTQTRQDNAAIRAARIRAEREAVARSQREADERVARSGVINPYTGRPFQTVGELENYGARLRAAEIEQEARKTGRSVEEVKAEREDREFIRKMRTEREEAGKAAQAAAQAAAAQKAFMQRDLEGFLQKHPGVDVIKLTNNQQFLRFCGSRLGKEPLAALYDDFRGIVGEAESVGGARARSARSRSTGSGGYGGEVLTAAQRRDLEAWNRENPDMRMTAKEFLGK